MLIEKWRTLGERCKTVKNQQQNKQSVEKLQNSNMKLNDASQKLSKSIKKYCAFKENNLAGKIVTESQDEVKNITSLIEDFEENSKPETLVSGNRLKILLDDAEKITFQIEEQLKTDWSEFVKTCYNGETSGHLKTQLPQDPHNASVLEEFKGVEDQINLEKSWFENDEGLDSLAATIESIQKLGKKQNELRQKFNENHPPEVDAFIRTLGRDGEVSLEMLTAEVSAWIEREGLAKHYKIRSG